MTTTSKRSSITPVHGGRLVANALEGSGIDTLFTLSGGHLFSIYDGCKAVGIDLVDVRHEQTAAFAAEGWSKVTRRLGACTLTAGPGVTNGVSAMASAYQNGSPMLVLGGRAPQFRWGQGSLQEFDHIPVVRSVTRFAETVTETAAISQSVRRAIDAALGRPAGPAFLDFPLDVVFMEAPPEVSPASVARMTPGTDPVCGDVEQAARLLARARRPVIMAGTNLYQGCAEGALRELVEAFGVPCFTSGLARGALPADHPNSLSRARRTALERADLVITVGVPLDFRLNFGAAIGEEADLVEIDLQPAERSGPRKRTVTLFGPIRTALLDLKQSASGEGASSDRYRSWMAELRAVETEKRAAEEVELNDRRAPLHPMRLYKELSKVLDPTATVIGDGGDFVSYAGRLIETFNAGHFIDPGPFGCLGSGPGYAIATAIARPDRQTVLLMGDGAFGFSGMEFDTMVRHKLPVVAVVGNNGIWGLEKHPMEFVYGYSVAADLRPGTRYDKVVEDLGGHGEFVERPDDLRPALERALESGLPSLVNVLLDPTVVYPRKAALA